MTSSNLEKKEHYYILFRFYGVLLTNKQQEYFKEYFFNDLSLKEIANLFAISRNGVYDSIVKAMNLLDNYEVKLKLYEKYQARKKIYDANQKVDFVAMLEEIDRI